MRDGAHVRTKYFEWLKDLIDENSIAESHLLLLKDLYQIPFYWMMTLDSNRAEDGLALREDYDIQCVDRESRGALIFLPEDCSVLEALIGLANRMDYELSSTSCTNNTPKYFWELVCNLGLSKYDDERYSEVEASDNVRKILENWMDREYSSDGIGSPFPLRSKDCDQRNLEIWYQMQAYIDENYEY